MTFMNDWELNHACSEFRPILIRKKLPYKLKPSGIMANDYITLDELEYKTETIDVVSDVCANCNYGREVHDPMSLGFKVTELF